MVFSCKLREVTFEFGVLNKTCDTLDKRQIFYRNNVVHSLQQNEN